MVYALVTVVLTTTVAWTAIVVCAPTMKTDDALGIIEGANLLGLLLLGYKMVKRRRGRTRCTSEHERRQ